MTSFILRNVSVMAALSVLLACGKSESAGVVKVHGESAPPRPNGTIVSTSDGSRFYGDDVAIDVYNYGSPQYRDQLVMVFLAGNGTDAWTAQTEVERSVLTTGAGTAEIKWAALEVGVANVERKRGDYAVARPRTGTFTYQLSEGQRVDVAIDCDENVVSGTVAARFQVRCWVNAKDLPRTDGQSPGEIPEGVSLALDEKFSTPQCAEFAAFGP